MTEANPNVFASEEVRNVERLHHDLFTDEFQRLPIRDQLDRQSQRVVEAHELGNKAVATHIKCWHPRLVGRSDEEIMSSAFTLVDARQTISREYGFVDWPDAEKRGVDPPDPVFEAAVDAIVEGDVEALRGLLGRRPSLVLERSDYGHRATLLHYVGSNGVETRRQRVPRNLAKITQMLLDAGADVKATADMYGGNCSTIALLITSGHPADAGVMDDVVKVLLDAGAETE